MPEELHRTVSMREAALLLNEEEATLIAEVAAKRLEPWFEVSELVRWRGTARTLDRTECAPDVGVGLGPPHEVEWEQRPPIEFIWPDRFVETYGQVFRAVLPAGDKERDFLVAFTERATAGMDNRARAIVFYGEPPRHRVLVEFVGDGDLKCVKCFASPIKRPGEHFHIKHGEPVPREYETLPHGRFSDVVKGPRAARSEAVIASRDDLTTMARHGIIRGLHRKLF